MEDHRFSKMNAEQFAEHVRKIHAAGHSFSASAVEHMSEQQYNATLNDVARMQRGAPEKAMLNLQSVAGGGVLGHSAEHIGDLTHRAGERYATDAGGSGRYSSEYVGPKVDSQIGVLSSRYGFAREHRENMESNARLRGVDADAHADAVSAAMDSYAEAHRSLPVYNAPMDSMRSAAIHLGRGNFDGSLVYLRDLDRNYMGSPEAYNAGMRQQGAVDWLKEQEEPR